METRPLGRTGHRSTVAVFGSAAFGEVSQEEADAAMELVVAAGVNHIDVAPSYGLAEERLGPWMESHRDRFFLGCKTLERTKAGAAAELRRSLEKLRTDRFDLYQLHAVTMMEELDAATGPGGALEAVLEARDEGLTRFVGITGHDLQAPRVFLEALRRFDFDTVMFPLNFVQFTNAEYRAAAEELLAVCREREVGALIIKSITRGPWGDLPETHTTWYRPWDEEERIRQSVDFALSQDVTGLCTAGDTRLLPLVLRACEGFTPMSEDERESLVVAAAGEQPLFV